MRRVPNIVSDGKVVALEPEVVTVAGAGAICACSASYLNTLRAHDAKRRLRGEPIEGPEWVRLGYGIRYRVRDLRAWLERTSEPGGVMENRRRSSAEPEPSGE